MEHPVNVLILEDNPSDVELMRRELRTAGLDVSAQAAQDKKSFLQALESSEPDLVLADYSLPGFDGLSALELSRQRFPELPVIIVSGAIGEETAVEMLKAGATDYVLKQRLYRLGSVVQRALEEARQKAERRRAEEALHASQRLLRTVLDGTDDPVYVKDRDSRMLMANAALERVTGVPLGQIIGRTDSEYYGDEQIGQALHEHDVRVMETGQSAIFEETVPTPDGLRVFSSNKAPYRNEAGDIIGIIGISRDITNRKKNEAELRYQADLLANIHDAVIAMNDKMVVTSWNKAAEKLYGWTAAEAIGRVVAELLHSEISEADRQNAIAQTIVHGHQSLEILHHRKNGEPVWVEASFILLRDMRGQVTGYATANRDITERKRAEELLRQANENLERRVQERTAELQHAKEDITAERKRFQDVLDAIPAYVVLLSPDYHVPFANRYFEERFGKSNGHRCYEYLFQRSEPCENCETFKALHEQRNLQWEWTGPDSRDYDIHDFPFTDTDGSPLILEMGIDITERKQAECELQRTNRALEMISQCNQVLVRVNDEQELLDEICKVIVEDGGYRMAWVGYAQQDEAKSVKPMAVAGYEDGYLDLARITWAAAERGRGPTGTAIRTGKVAMARWMETDKLLIPWRAEALARGYRSSIVLPLRDGDRTFGALTIYAVTPDAFDENEGRLLAELADDLSFGILALRERIARRQAEDLLRQANEDLEQRVQERTAEAVASEKRYRQLFEQMTDGFALHDIICDADGKPVDYRFVELNPAFEKLTGLRRDNVIGRPVREVIADIEPLWIERYGQVALTGEPVRFENYFAPLDRVYDILAYCPAPGQFAVIFEDVTLRKNAERDIFLAKQDWERTFDAVPDLIAILDKDYRIRRVNRQMAQRLQMTPEQCIGLRCFEAMHGCACAPEICPHRLTLRDGKPHEAELREERLDGQFIVTTTPLTDARGEHVGTVHVARDITTRKKAEDELREKAALLDLARDSIVVRSLDRRILYWNHGGETTYGYTAEEAVGQIIPELLRMEFVERNLDEIDRIVLQQGYHQDEIIHYHKDGRRLNMDVQWSLLCDESGNPQSILQVNRDITARKRAEDEVRWYAERLEEMVKERTEKIRTLERLRMADERQVALGRMAARIAHEINNPLAGIKNSFTLVKRAVPADHRHYQFVNIIDGELDRIARIVRQMYELYRPTTKAAGAFRLDTVMHDMLAMLQMNCTKNKITLDCDPVAPVSIETNEDSLKQVLNCLVQNAIEASPHGSRIRIAADVAFDQLTLTVADHGCGIPPEIQPQIFEPFFTTKFGVGNQGMGLGLSVAKGIVDSFGGSLTFESEPNVGTTFKLVLPVIVKPVGKKR